MSRGPSKRQASILAVLARSKHGLETSEIVDILHACPHEQHTECLASRGYVCSTTPRAQLMSSARRALDSLVLRGLVVGEYAHDEQGRRVIAWQVKP